MIKILWSVLCSMVLFSSLNTSYAADGTINFNGKIIDSACSITGGSGKVIPLGNVPKNILDTVGKKSPFKDFSIELTGCPVGDNGVTSIALKFSGKSVEGANDLIQLDNVDGVTAAEGVGVFVKDKADKTIIPGNDYLIEPGKYGTTVKIPLMVAYQAHSAVVRPGAASATLSFDIVYK